MIDAIFSALAGMATVQVFGFMMLGVVAGMAIGVLPGLGGVAGMTLLIPFVFGMDPISGIAMLVGMAAITQTSDTFPSVLLGVPGSSSSQATIIDGYALTRNGEASRALGAGFTASMMGGVFGAVALLGVVALAREAVGFLGSPELLMLTVLGLATVGVIVKGNSLLGLTAALIGVMLGTIGTAPAVPVFRYTFGQVYLFAGLDIVIVALGLFAIPEAISLLVERKPISRKPAVEGAMMQGVRDAWRNKGLVLRGSLLGVGVGALPGIGGGAVDWISYAMAKSTCRNTERFGKGDIRGVIAPESANNAKEGGVLMPTLILGIPGSGTTAVLLGGLILMGLTPGPEMVTQNLDVTLTVVWTLAVANVVATGSCILLSRYISRIVFIPAELLSPFLIVLFFVGAYQASRSFPDMIMLVAIGLLGYLMKLVSWPRAPALIGFVLASSLERYLHLSISRYGFEWLERPGVVAIGVITLLMLTGGPLLRYARNR